MPQGCAGRDKLEAPLVKLATRIVMTPGTRAARLGHRCTEFISLFINAPVRAYEGKRIKNLGGGNTSTHIYFSKSSTKWDAHFRLFVVSWNMERV